MIFRFICYAVAFTYLSLAFHTCARYAPFYLGSQVCIERISLFEHVMQWLSL